MGHTGFRSNLDAWRRGLATQDEVETALLQELTADPRLHPVVLSLIEAYRQAGHLPVPFAERLLTLEVGGKPRQAARVSHRPLGSGRILANQYAVEGLVPGGDRGGSGLVFKARDLVQEEALDRNPFVAIKVFNDKFKRDPDSLAALHREYKHALKLSHPNIVKLQNFNRDGADVFIVMELLEGHSLEARALEPATSARPVALEAWRIVEALSQALGYAHRLGIVHSDFKPSNAFVTHDGVIKVLDFGFARAIKRTALSTQSNTGEWTHVEPQTQKPYTSCYASCEQIGGASPDPRDDVYALGVVCYELLAGSHPFERKDAATARHLGLRPRAIPGLSRRQWHTLQASLSFKREERPADAVAFGSGLKPKPWPLKLMAVGATALAVLILALGVLVLGWMERRNAEAIAAGLDSPVNAVADDAVKRLAQAGEAVRETVLMKDGAKKKVLAVYERQVRSAFDPQLHVYDYARAEAILDNARAVLPDYEPLGEFADSLKTAASRKPGADLR
jgi:hypothetical protein